MSIGESQQYRPGDVVNGYRLSPDGSRWEPVLTYRPTTGPGQQGGWSTSTKIALGLIAAISALILGGAALIGIAVAAGSGMQEGYAQETYSQGAGTGDSGQYLGNSQAVTNPDAAAARDLWNGLSAYDQNLLCTTYWGQGPGAVYYPLFAAGYPEPVVRELLDLLDTQVC